MRTRRGLGVLTLGAGVVLLALVPPVARAFDAPFYLTLFGKVKRLGPGADAPLSAKVVGAASLTLWTAVIVCGRLLTFYRPFDCGPDGPGILATCLPH